MTCVFLANLLAQIIMDKRDKSKKIYKSCSFVVSCCTLFVCFLFHEQVLCPNVPRVSAVLLFRCFHFCGCPLAPYRSGRMENGGKKTDGDLALLTKSLGELEVE